MKLLEWRVPGMVTVADLEAVRTVVDQMHGVALIAAYLATSGYPVAGEF